MMDRPSGRCSLDILLTYGKRCDLYWERYTVVQTLDFKFCGFHPSEENLQTRSSAGFLSITVHRVAVACAPDLKSFTAWARCPPKIFFISSFLVLR